jgi:hypothetical protein
VSDLTRFRDHCRTMAADPLLARTDRELWGRLADEVDDYLADDTDATTPIEWPVTS